MTQDTIDAFETVALSSIPEEKRELLLRRYESDVYNPAFPNEEIREDPTLWLSLLASGPYPPPHPLIEVILLVGPDDDIAGGVTIEFYRQSGCGLLTYIAVNERYRGRGLARLLIAEARAALERLAGKRTLIFGETERLCDAASETERVETRLRQARLDALGARIVDFDYLMPPLRPNLSPHRLHFLLLSGDETSVDAESVSLLLGELAAALGADLQSNDETRSMMRALASESRLALKPLALRHFDEVPIFCDIRSSAFTYAFELKYPGDIENPRSIRVATVHERLKTRGGRIYESLIEPMRSFIDDVTMGPIGSYGRPLLFRASGTRGDHHSRAVTLVRPESWTYAFEGEVTEIATAGDRRIPMRMHDSFCVFESGRIFYLLTLTQPKEDAVALSEYGVIQLQRLATTDDRAEDSRYLGFEYNGESLHSLCALAEARLIGLEQDDGEAPNGYTQIMASEEVGILPRGARATINCSSIRSLCVAIEDPLLLETVAHADDVGGASASSAIQVERDWQDKVRAEQKTPHAEDGNQIDRTLLAFAGMAQAIPDFPFQDESEVYDSTRSICRMSDSALFAHPRFLMEIGKQWRSFDAKREQIGTCPYLMLKWLVAMHDELVVSDMEKRIDEMVYEASGRATIAEPLGDVHRVMKGARNLVVLRDEVLEKNLDRRLALLRWATIYRSGNLFRYPREREALTAIIHATDINQRFERAHMTVDRIEALIKDVSDLKAAYGQSRANRILFALAMLGVITTAKDIVSVAGTSNAWTTILIGLVLIGLLFSLLLINRGGSSD